MEGILRIVRPGGFALGSVAIHAAIAWSFFVVAQPSNRRFLGQTELIDVTVEPALGQAHGKKDGRGLGSRVPASLVEHRPQPPLNRPPPPTRAAAFQPQAPDPGIPVDKHSPWPTRPEGSVHPQAPGPMAAGPVPDPGTPVGTANVAPALGSPDGTLNGTGLGPPKPRMSPQYKGMLAGWFSARFVVRGLGMPFEELRKLRTTTTVNVSPDRRVTSFTVGASGNGAFDEQVRRTLSEIQASGVALPPPTDDSVLPPSFPIAFQCKDERRCM